METTGHRGADRGAVQQAQLLIQTGRVDDAIALLFRHLSSDPDDAAALEMLPGALFTVGRHTEALMIATSLATEHPTNPDMAIILAELATAMMRWDDAVDAAHNAIDLAPTSFDAYRILAIALSAEERRPEAEAAMRRALELGDAQGVAETDLLALQVDVLSDWPGRKDEALAFARKAIAIDPTNDRHRSRLATMHVGRRDYWAAVRTSLGVLTTSPTTDIPRGTLLIALAGTLYRTIWWQIGIVFVSLLIGVGGVAGLFVSDPVVGGRLVASIAGLLGSVLHALLVWRIAHKVGRDRQVYRNILRTVRQFPGAIVALVLQSLAVLFLLLSAVTGLVGFLPAALVAVVAAFVCFKPTEKTMASQGVLLFGPEFAAAVGVR
jgi:tetratricopeptide (TPR) repeat protein